MQNHQKNIYPVFHKIIQREDKERRLHQKAIVVWFAGLSGAGKTTLAKLLEEELFARNFMVQILDGDNIRSGINSNLSFTEVDRRENIRRIAEVSKLFMNCGIIAINSFISPTREVRHIARDIIGKENFVEVYINAPLAVCEKRDVKGLYARARKGEIKDFTGISSPFEVPEYADLEIRTDLLTIEESVDKLLEFLLPRVTLFVDNEQSAVSSQQSAVEDK
jgi:adenylylsulfate kinase